MTLMRDYSNEIFVDLLESINNDNQAFIQSEISNEDLIWFKYFLIRRFYYVVIVDDYPIALTDKSSLLEALYYQVPLITVHDLNWDAVQEGLNDVLHYFSEFKGICLLFRHGRHIAGALKIEFQVLSEIVQGINKQCNAKKIEIILNVSSPPF
jgi:Barstar (barnase inhibitor)